MIAAIAALLLAIETKSTLCQATPVPAAPGTTDRTLIGCGEGFPDNLAWAVDRSDSIDGTLDGRVTRRTTGAGAVVYVLDTGVEASHDEFMRAGGSVVIAGIEVTFVRPRCASENYATDPCYTATSSGEHAIYTHGTAAASMIAGKNSGVAPDAKLVSVLIQSTTPADWIAAMKAIARHAWSAEAPPFRTAIINLSGAMSFTADAGIEEMVRRMISGVDAEGNASPNGKRFLFVTAAGNALPLINGKPVQCDDDYGVKVFPNRLAPSIDGLVSVGAITRENRLWEGTCRGPLVELLAPGSDVLVASISGPSNYRYLPDAGNHGTSYSTPYVSGMAARLLQDHPAATPAELEAMLKASPSRVEGVAVPVGAVVRRRRAL